MIKRARQAPAQGIVDCQTRLLSPRQIQGFFQTLQQQNPHPRTELIYRNPFELLVAVMLSAQATDVSVNKATAKLFPVANTPSQLLALGEAGLKPFISSIGLYNSKARHVIATCELLLREHQGEVPNDRSALERLPGVGRKTANVILNTAFGQPTIAVDTHIFRVARRLQLSAGNTPLAVENDLLRVIPKTYRQDAHHWLILHGRYVCTARSPRCSQCIIASLCNSTDKE